MSASGTDAFISTCVYEHRDTTVSVYRFWIERNERSEGSERVRGVRAVRGARE